MTEIRAFRALRYDAERVDLGRVLVPPYDVVSAEERAQFYDRDPHSAIRLELTREVGEELETDYGQVARILAEWQRDGVLRRDSAPAIYALRQRFSTPDGEKLARDGFFAALRLEDYERRVVRPHERTLRGPKADRLKLLRATRANLSSVFFLYEDPEHALAAHVSERLDAGPERVAIDAAGVEHAVLPIRDPEAIGALQRFLAARPVVIADGHHRYETALTYRDERRRAEPGAGAEAPFEFALGYFANVYAPGSLLLPIHRIVRGARGPDDAAWRSGLPGWREQRIPIRDPETVPQLLREHLAPLAGSHAFAADDGGGVLRIFSRPAAAGELGIRALHQEVLGGVFGLDDEAIREGAVAFPKNAAEAARAVRRETGVALYLNPLAPEDVFRVTGAGELLPQKSTFFHPKLPTGLVFRLLCEDAP
jgi:uncharacterized protein (DUF1015 family)